MRRRWTHLLLLLLLLLCPSAKKIVVVVAVLTVVSLLSHRCSDDDDDYVVDAGVVDYCTALFHHPPDRVIPFSYRAFRCYLCYCWAVPPTQIHDIRPLQWHRDNAIVPDRLDRCDSYWNRSE